MHSKTSIYNPEQPEVFFNNLSDLIEKANGKTLIVFDVDEVLLTPKDSIFSRSNSSKYSPSEQINRYIKQSGILVDEDRLSDSITFIERSHVDERMKDIVDKIFDKNIKSLALTACDFGEMYKHGNKQYATIEEWREADLIKIGINFKELSQLQSCKELLTIQDWTLFDEALLYNGIIFTDGYDKGKCLGAALQKLAWQPSNIIFIDDRMYNIRSVEKFCKKNNIDFCGFHYTAAEYFNTECNPARENLQIKTLVEEYRWLHDDEADAILANNTNIELAHP